MNDKLKKLEETKYEKILWFIENKITTLRRHFEKRRLKKNKKLLVELWLDYEIPTPKLISYLFAYFSRGSERSTGLLKTILDEQKKGF